MRASMDAFILIGIGAALTSTTALGVLLLLLRQQRETEHPGRVMFVAVVLIFLPPLGLLTTAGLWVWGRVAHTPPRHTNQTGTSLYEGREHLEDNRQARSAATEHRMHLHPWGAQDRLPQDRQTIRAL